MYGKFLSFLKRNKRLVVIVLLTLVIKLITYFPSFIEHLYHPNIYRPLSIFMRIIFGWIPISLGDIFYAVVIGLLVLQVYKLVVLAFKRQLSLNIFLGWLKKAVIIFLGVYIFFNLWWGLNYNRMGIAYQLQLQPEKYSKEDLKMITRILLKKVNDNRRPFADSIISISAYQKVFASTVKSYQQIEKIFPFLAYHHASLKKSYYGRLGNYLGFLGYYNPFTAEAQVNLTIPRFSIPYVCCHEIAHQLGYASESEANFVGYLAAVHSKSILYHYSAYFDLFRYANNELARLDTSAAKENYNQLDRRVKGDYMQMRDYVRKSENPLEPVIEVFYDYYLKANQQENGVESYNEVVGWLIAYKKKYGTI